MLTAGSLGKEERSCTTARRVGLTLGGIGRREFLRLGGVGLTGVALLGAAGCGSSEDRAGGTTITLAFTPDEAGGLEKLIREFNERNRGEIQVKWREMPATSADYYGPIQAEFMSAPDQQKSFALESARVCPPSGASIRTRRCLRVYQSRSWDARLWRAPGPVPSRRTTRTCRS